MLMQMNYEDLNGDTFQDPAVTTGGSTIGVVNSTSNSSYWPTLVASFLFLIVFLFNYKSPIQFYVKYIVYVTITMTFSLCAIPFAALRPNNPKNVNWVSWCLNFLFRIFKVNIKLENAEYLQLNQPYILISNHQSSLDLLTMMNIWPGGKCTPLAKKELWYAGPFGVASWLCGITFIDRLNSEKAKDTIHALAQRINDEKLRVWIYPEGTRNLGTQLLKFKKGAFHLAIQAQVPVVCVVTSSYLNFYNKKERRFLPNGEVIVRVLPPFQTRGMTPEKVDQLAKHLQDRMQKEFDLLNQEIHLDKSMDESS